MVTRITHTHDDDENDDDEDGDDEAHEEKIAAVELPKWRHAFEKFGGDGINGFVVAPPPRSASKIELIDGRSRAASSGVVSSSSGASSGVGTQPPESAGGAAPSGV